MRKSLIITTCLLTLLPLSKVAADESLVEVVDAVINESLDAKLLQTDRDIPLSADAYRYQDGFKALKEIGNEQRNLNKKMAIQGIKYDANQLVYGYYKGKQVVKLQEENLKLIEKEYENSQERYKEGMSTKGAVLKAKIGVNEAELAVKTAKLKLTEATLQLNQKLGKEFNAELTIQTIPEFSLLGSIDYDAEIIAKEMKDKHPSLVLIRKKLQEYSNILNRIDSLPHLDEKEFLKELHGFDQQLHELTSKMDETNSIIDGKQLNALKSQKQLAEATHEKVSKAYQEAQENGTLTQDSKEEYLKKLASLEQQISKSAAQIEDVEAEIVGAEEALSGWKNAKVELEASRVEFLKEYDKSLEEQRKAKLELKEYYANEIQKTEIELVQAERIVKLKAYDFQNRFEVLSNQIKLAEEKVEQSNREHNQQKELYELGEIIFLDVQKSQQQLRTTELELTNDQLDYQLVKEEFSLFKAGYMM